MAKILTIDTSNNKKISVGLEVNNKRDEITQDSTVLRSEAALPAIEKLLQKNKLNI